MQLPKIEINGVIYTMIKPKANGWEKIIKFDNERAKIPLEDYVNKLCEFMATLFDGLTADDLLNNLMLDEVQKIYRECYQCYWDLLSGKFEELEKNSPTAEVAVN